jgi:hypothetical protein
MTIFKRLQQKYNFNIEDFETSKKNYYNFCNRIDNADYSLEKSQEAYLTLCKKFEDILKLCVSEAGITENLEIYFDKEKYLIPKVGLETQITNIPFTIGLFRNFYIVTELKNPHNLKIMKDEFWSLIFKLSELGKFKFKENEKPSDSMRIKYPQLFNKQGNYYKLLRNYFLYEIEYGQIRSLGYISVSWDDATSFKNLIVSFCEAFRIMYQLNLMLWRPDNKNIKL